MKPCIRYEAEKWSDGAGAQLQRIAATYSISQAFGLNYIHQDVLHIESNPGDGFQTIESKIDFVRKLNRQFHFSERNCTSSHTNVSLKYRKIMKFRFSAQLYFFSIRILAFFSRKHFLYVCDNPYPILENYPNIYGYFTDRFGKKTRSNDDCVQIQMHVRSDKKGNQLMLSRHVELHWYVDILKFIVLTLKRLDLKYRVLIHTDAPSEEVIWEPLDISDATAKFWKSANVMNQGGKISLSPIDFEQAFDFVENVEVIRNIDPVQAWEIMSVADVLILGRSSFSIFAGLINNHSLIIAPKYRHKFPGEWFIQGEEVKFNKLQRTRIEEYFMSLSKVLKRLH